MRHFIILSSFNRPRWIRRAIRSVMAQTVGTWKMIVADDGSDPEAIASIRGGIFGDPRCLLLAAPPDGERSRADGAVRAVRMINEALKLVDGDLVHYLADDDLYDPARLEAFEELFSDPSVKVGYGKYEYIDAMEVSRGDVRFAKELDDPAGVLDHNQVCHRTETLATVPRWPLPPTGDYAIDAWYFSDLFRFYRFVAMDRMVAKKRIHAKGMLFTLGGTDRLRE